MPSTSAAQHRVGEPTTECGCGRQRVWKHARKIGNSWQWRRYCSHCHGQKSMAARRRRLPEYNANLRLRRQTEPKLRAYQLWRGALGRAAKRGIEFSLSRKFVEATLVGGKCQVTGLTFNLSRASKRMGSLAPSIDRKDPMGGYTDQNSQVVCWMYNRAKGDGTHADVMLLAEALNAIYIAKAA